MALKHDNKCTIEKPPKMLKDFLQEINTPSHPTVHATVDALPRSRSRPRYAINSFQKLVNAVKSLQRSKTSKTSNTSPQLTLTRSISRSLIDRFSVKKKKRSKSNDGILHKVKIKDILRWGSFRDKVTEDPIVTLDSLQFEYDHMVLPNDTTISTCSDIIEEYDDHIVLPNDKIIPTYNSTCSDIHFQNDIVTSNTVTTSTKNSFGLESELGGSGFCTTMDELPCWWGSFIEESKQWDQNNDVVTTVSDVENKEDNHRMTIADEKEQHSPVSVLDSPFRDEISDHEYESSFDKSFANMERTKKSLFQSILWLESLAGVSEDDDDIDEVEREEEPIKDDKGIVKKTKANLNRAIGKFKRSGNGFEDIDVYIKEMEKQVQWSEFEEEKEGLGVELEVHFLRELVNEVLTEVFG